jgi:putative ATP-binding cassette transporter
VIVAVLYASAGTTAAMLIGRPLVKAANKRQTFEANFRFGLVRARENSEAIALSHGEHDERRRLVDLFADVARGWDRQTVALCNVFLFSSGYSVLATAFPILVASPRYIAGTITLGMLMQTAQAFQQMAAALSWPIDNLSRAAEWRAAVDRVMVLHNALEMLGEERSETQQAIAIEPGGDGMTFRDLSIANPDGEVVVSRFNARVAEGERVLITGDPGAALKLFKVVAGLWPWGRGLVELPAEGVNIFFMPHRPYLPIGKLRGAIAYPTAPDWFEDEQFVAVLARVGLGHLAPRLDDEATWEKELAYGDMQRLGFARLLLHRPDWIFIEEATDAIDPEGEKEMMRLLRDDFPAATIITVGNHPALEEFHDRKLMLTRSTDGMVLVNEGHVLRKSAKDRPTWLGRFLNPLIGRKG